MPVGMRNREWEGGSSLIMMSAGGTVTSGDQEKEWDDVILYRDIH